MSITKTSGGLAATALILVLASASAQAQATKTWVSGVGDDANPCSRTAPCKTFAGAISKTAAGGEISVLDPGGYGNLTITKSIGVVNDNSGTAYVTATGGTSGIIVNAGPSDIVTLRGFSIDGAGSGLRGVRFIAGGALHIQNAAIRNFPVSGGTGVDFAPSASAKLFIRDTVISRNGQAATGGGIVVKPTGGFSSVTLTRVTLDNNSNGLVVDTTTTAGGVFLQMLDSSASSNGNTGVALIGGVGASQSFVTLQGSASVNNTTGVSSTGANSNVQLSQTLVTGNTTGLSTVNSGKIVSFGNNVFGGNTNQGAPTSTVTTQ